MNDKCKTIHEMTSYLDGDLESPSGHFIVLMTIKSVSFYTRLYYLK
jgi:hypothetical protein